jgi:hypothetical protein
MSLTTYPEPNDAHEEYLYWLRTHQDYDTMTATQKNSIDARYEDLLNRIDDEYETKKLFDHEDFRLDY